MSGGEDGAQGAYKTPPYVAFKTFNTLIEDLKEHGLPTQIDRSVLRRFSGGVGSQLVSALKALKLVQDDNRPSGSLKPLVDAYGTDNYPAAVRDMLGSGYPYLSHLDLKIATPSQFAEAFKVTGAKEDVLRKSRTFYLHAAQYSGVEIGSRLLNGSAPRKAPNGSGPVRKKSQAKRTTTDTSNTPPPPPPPNPAAGAALEYRIVDILKMEGVGEEETKAVFTLVKFLTMKKATG
jgi:hypothetical protein